MNEQKNKSGIENGGIREGKKDRKEGGYSEIRQRKEREKKGGREEKKVR